MRGKIFSWRCFSLSSHKKCPDLPRAHFGGWSYGWVALPLAARAVVFSVAASLPFPARQWLVARDGYAIVCCFRLIVRYSVKQKRSDSGIISQEVSVREPMLFPSLFIAFFRCGRSGRVRGILCSGIVSLAAVKVRLCLPVEKLSACLVSSAASM